MLLSVNPLPTKHLAVVLDIPIDWLTHPNTFQQVLSWSDKIASKIDLNLIPLKITIDEKFAEDNSDMLNAKSIKKILPLVQQSNLPQATKEWVQIIASAHNISQPPARCTMDVSFLDEHIEFLETRWDEEIETIQFLKNIQATVNALKQKNALINEVPKNKKHTNYRKL